MATHETKHDPRQDSKEPYNPGVTVEPETPEQQRQKQEDRAAAAKKLFDDNEAHADDRPVTTQTDQLRRSAEMEQVGPQAWMNEAERRIREREGDPISGRQVQEAIPSICLLNPA